jgi:archaellum component FlaG (FlaF/FlaG flagellin family)
MKRPRKRKDAEKNIDKQSNTGSRTPPETGNRVNGSVAATGEVEGEAVELYESNTNTQTLTPEQEADVVIVEVKRELRRLFVKSKELIKRSGNALKKIVKRERDICEEIKIALKEEIAEGIISTRTIELHCLPEWKREWKRRTKSESEKNSLSSPQSMAVAKTQDGKSVTETEKEVGNGLDTSPQQPEQDSSKHGPSATVQQEETVSPQPGPGIGIGSVSQQPVCESCLTKDAKIMGLEEALKNLKATAVTGNDIEASSVITKPNIHTLLTHPSDKYIGQECPSCLELQDKVTQLSEALQQISMQKADQIPASEFDVIIPKKKMRDAMDKSKSVIFVKCDGSKKFVRAVADVDN